MAKDVRTRGPEKREKYVAFRWTLTEYERIGQRAKKRDLTLTEYVVRACLGELVDPDETSKRLDAVEDRLARLERMVDLGGFG